jgi:peptidoglycan-associated lipoprotein
MVTAMKAKPLAFLAVVGAFAALLLGCPDKKLKYPSCAGDKDCKAAEHCVNKKCVQCADDSHCAAGEQCVAGACTKKDGFCSADGDCPAGQVCKENQCVACKSDGECGEGGRCVDGGCLRKGQCKNDEDCPEDEDCIKGVCTKAGAAGGGGDEPKCTLEAIQFGFDQYSIPDEAKPILQKNADCLSTTPKGIAVIGMTDNRGTDEYNIGLSDDRAQSVITYLARLGIDPSRMRKVPKGEGEATGSDEAGWARDRRVEFKWE